MRVRLGFPTYLEPHKRLTLVVLIRRDTGRLSPDDAEFHVLDLQSDQQEVDPADNDVLEMVLALAVFELYVQTILDTNIHLDDAVGLGRHAVRVDPDILLAHDILHAARDGDADKVAQAHVDAGVGFVCFLDVLEGEWEGLGMLQVTGRGQLGL